MAQPEKPIFGKDFTLSFSLADENEGYIGLDDAELVSARVYDHAPSNAEEMDSGEALGTEIEAVNAWDDGDADSEKRITFSALTDPSPQSIGYEDYYLTVNFKLQSGGDIKFATYPFEVIRPSSLQHRMVVTAAEIGVLEADIYNGDGNGMMQADEVTAIIAEVKKQVIRKFRAMGRKWKQYRETDIRNYFFYKALEQLCVSNAKSGRTEEWLIKADRYAKKATEALNEGLISVDEDEDGKPDRPVDFGTIELAR